MSENVIGKVHSALELEPRIKLHSHPIRLSYGSDDVLFLDGEVEDVAAKKMALRIAAAASGARGIVDRLRLVPAQSRGDGLIKETIAKFIEEEPVFLNASLKVEDDGKLLALREKDGEGGIIVISVENGIITLDGEVLSLSHKRLAGALAFWTPGVRDVVNGLEVSPPEKDEDDEITDGISLILEKDPLIHDPSQIRVVTKDGVVALSGLVTNEEERKTAEMDAWITFGVDKVENGLGTRS